jgi:hypothetical protein
LLCAPQSDRKKERAANFWKFADTLTGECADMLAPAVQKLWKAKLVGMAEARPVLAKMEAVVNSTRAV